MPIPAIESSDHRLKSASRSSGTLSAWAITSTGSGTPNCSTNSRSTASSGAAANHASINRVVIERITGSSSAITFGVNAFEMRRRYRVWSGMSAVSIVGTRGYPSAITAAIRSCASPGIAMLAMPNCDE